MSSDFIKHDNDKNRLELLPFDALFEIGKVLTYGAKKYEDYNWAKNANWSRYAGAALRHIFTWMCGGDKDGETGMSHLAHAACCIIFLISYELNGLGTDDRYGRFVKPTTKQ